MGISEVEVYVSKIHWVFAGLDFFGVSPVNTKVFTDSNQYRGHVSSRMHDPLISPSTMSLKMLNAVISPIGGQAKS